MSANGAMVTRRRTNTGLLFFALLGQFSALIFVNSANSVAATPSLTILKQATTLSLLSTLPVKGKAPKTGYSREAFRIGETQIEMGVMREMTFSSAT